MLKEESIDKNLNDYLKSRFIDAVLDDSEKILIYDKFDSELTKLKNGVVIRNMSDKDFYNLYGNDVFDFLHRISTNSIKDLSSNEKVETLFLNEKGRLIDDTTLIKTDYEAILIANMDPNSKLERWIERYIISEDIKLVKNSGKYFLLEFWGPQAESYLTLICGKFVDALTFKNVVNVNVEGLIFKIYKNKTPDGEVYFSLLGDMLISTRLIEYLLNHNRIFDLGMIGEAAFDYFRIKKGYPKFPNEINVDFNPHEINLMHKVDDKKGCYIGQEVIARLETYDKVQKEMVGLIFEEFYDVIQPLEIFETNEKIGKVTSICKFGNNKKIGIGLVKKNKDIYDSKIKLINENNNQEYFAFVKKLPMKL